LAIKASKIRAPSIYQAKLGNASQGANTVILNFCKFDASLLSSTKEAWITSADNLGIPSLDYEKTLNFAATHLVEEGSPNKDLFTYGVFEVNSSEALAVIDVIYKKRPGPDVGWLKMLSVDLSPTFSPTQVDASPEKLSQVIDIYSEAILGVLKLSDVHKARIMKIYGRNDSLLTLLIALNERLRATNLYATKMEGRWLVVSAN
jgi:hypothetical protein